MKRRAKIGLRKKWLISAGIALVLFAGLEISLRLLTDYSSRWNVRLGAHKRFDKTTLFRVKSDYRFPNGVSTNENGFLAPRGLSFEKPEDRLRLIYLGDSVTFWYPGGNYPSTVEKNLEAETDLEIETINAAVPGFASHNARALFETDLSRYAADYFFLLLGWNDLSQFGPEGLPYKRMSQGYEVSSLQSLLSNVYSVRMIYQLQRMLRARKPAFDQPLGTEEQRLYEDYYPQHYEDNLRAILRGARARYPNVYVMTVGTLCSDSPTEDELSRAHFPVGMDKNLRKLTRLVRRYNEVVRKVAHEEQVGLIDLEMAFDSVEGRKMFNDTCHVNDAGAERIARAVMEVIDTSRAIVPAASIP